MEEKNVYIRYTGRVTSQLLAAWNFLLINRNPFFPFRNNNNRQASFHLLDHRKERIRERLMVNDAYHYFTALLFIDVQSI